MVGFLVYSLAGHDKGTVYYIVKEEKDYYWLVDGKVRTLDKPKKKNKKHLQIIKVKALESVTDEINEKEITNEMIKKAISLYCKDIQEVK